jgi:cellulose synthase/poly-beta-1,6-N-acetylglucosamine synthase-like glycosyltransferase
MRVWEENAVRTDSALMSPPAISVVMPAYNSAETIGRALDSVFAQTVSDYEIVIVDDGSKDDLESALRPYATRVRLLKQANQGPSAARNLGARAAIGHYIAFLDADDFWHPRKLELQLAAFRAHPTAVLCWTDHGYWRPGDPVPSYTLGVNQEQPVISEDFESLFLDPYLGTPGVMLRKTEFERLGGFREDLHSAEDIDLWLRVAYGGATVLLRAPLFFVVSTPNSLTARRGDGTFEDNLRVIQDFCRANPAFGKKSAHAVNRAQARVYEEWGSAALADGRFAQAADLLWRSLGHRIGKRAVYLWTKAMISRLLRA